MRTKKYISILSIILTFAINVIEAKEKADYIVIGVGTSGGAMAKLLTDDLSTSVIALHNGKNLVNDPDIKYSKFATFTVISALFGSSFYQTGESPPQPNADDREIFWALAVPEGGASSINAGAWARGTNQVYSQWEDIAGPAWSASKIQDIYIYLENYLGATTDPAARGYNGPVNVRQVPNPTPFMTKLTQSVETATGVPFVLDYNDPNTPIGASAQLQYTQKGENGNLRVSSATAFLNDSIVTPSGKGVGGRKLKIKFNSTALRTIWDGNTAIGVEYFQDGKIKKVYAKKGVIVCAGLYSSAFLMHSGVGPSSVLAPLGIKVKYDNPNVGLALADQPGVLIAFTADPADTPVVGTSCGSLPSSLTFNGLDTPWIFNIPNLPEEDRSALLEAILCKTFAVLPENSPFAQISMLPAPGGDPTIRSCRFTTINPVPGIGAALVDLIQPQSRGRITIDSANPFDKPVVDTGTFSIPNDLSLYVQIFQTYIKNIFSTLNGMDSKYQLVIPPPEILDDTELLTDFIKESVGSNQVWQCHCRMAPLGQGGVVDSTGRVYGVQNLFVADTSISPVMMDGTTMASAYMIATNIAMMLLSE